MRETVVDPELFLPRPRKFYGRGIYICVPDLVVLPGLTVELRNRKALTYELTVELPSIARQVVEVANDPRQYEFRWDIKNLES